MANKTALPNLGLINIATPTNPKITLVTNSLIGDSTATLSSGITTTFGGSAPTLETLLTFKNTAGQYLQCSVPAGGFTSSTTITNMKRGIEMSGIDLETEISGLDVDLLEGSEVVSAIPAQLFQLLYAWGKGEIASGGNVLTIGDGTASNNTLQILDDTGTLGLVRKNYSTGKAQFSNDGTLWTNFDNAGVGVLTAGNAIDAALLATGTVQVDPTEDTNVFVKTSSGAGDENKAAILNASGKFADGFINDIWANDSTLTAKGSIYAASAASIPAELTVGSNNQALIADSGESTGLKYAYIPLVLDKSYTDVTISNTTDETNLVNFSVPAGTLQTAQAIRVRAYISGFSLSNTKAFTLKLKYGSTTIATAATGASVGALTTLRGYIDADLYATGATNTQKGSASMRVQANGADATAASPDLAIANIADEGTAAEDSTGALNLTLTGQFDNASANDNITLAHYTIEYLPA